jgi:hypothetical protein
MPKDKSVKVSASQRAEKRVSQKISDRYRFPKDKFSALTRAGWTPRQAVVLMSH